MHLAISQISENGEKGNLMQRGSSLGSSDLEPVAAASLPGRLINEERWIDFRPRIGSRLAAVRGRAEIDA